MSDNYKYKSLKIYASNEWLYESKKYRQVFDSNEVRHIYAELAFLINALMKQNGLHELI